MQKTKGSSRREVTVRFSHRSIGEGRKDKSPDEDGAANIDADEDASTALLPLLLFVVLLDVDPPLGREPPKGICECSGEFTGCSSSSDACPARSNFERGAMGK